MAEGYPIQCNRTGDGAPPDSFDAVVGSLMSTNTAVHPGLLLDRFVGYTANPAWTALSFDQKLQKEHLDKVVRHSTRLGALAGGVPPMWDELCRATDAKTWKHKTIWRFALHLSRATAVENASLCLHPIYGFTYIPATGLKGLARATAVLIEKRDDKTDPDILRIFGKQEGAGSVIFHDAWPVAWPKIEVDIVNNHHPDYYKDRGENGSAPGDWESPNPVYFLTVVPGTEFRFGIAKRHHETHPDDVDQARRWLQQGLQELGAGAKTAAGYGYFEEPTEYAVPPPLEPPDPSEAEWSDAVRGFASGFRTWLADGADGAVRGNFLNELNNMTTEDRAKAVEWALERIADIPELTTRRETKQGPKPSFAEQLQARLG